MSSFIFGMVESVPEGCDDATRKKRNSKEDPKESGKGGDEEHLPQVLSPSE